MERFWSKVDRRGPDECWPWKAGLFKATGYGQFHLDGRQRTAHVVAWELANQRPMPAGMCGLHTCDNRPCCNPAHVFPGTRKDNVDDMCSKGRAKYGHVPGEANGRAKLTDQQVLAIRDDTRFQRVIAADYGIARQLVSQIKLRQVWRHL